MKISIVIADGVKQIMMTPESEHEKEAMRYIAPKDELVAVAKKGTYDDKPQHFGYQSEMCQGGYLRRFAQEESLVFVIKDNPVENSPTD